VVQEHQGHTVRRWRLLLVVAMMMAAGMRALEAAV
jgi:hypothetical protein